VAPASWYLALAMDRASPSSAAFTQHSDRTGLLPHAASAKPAGMGVN